MASMCGAVGTSILDIGSRKGAAAGPLGEGQEGHHVPGMFGLPNVGNVSLQRLVVSAAVAPLISHVTLLVLFVSGYFCSYLYHGRLCFLIGVSGSGQRSADLLL